LLTANSLAIAVANDEQFQRNSGPVPAQFRH
jgi:hypothetical protein